MSSIKAPLWKLAVASLTVFLVIGGKGYADPHVIPPDHFQKIILPFSFKNKRNMVVQGKIRGKTVQFIVDTGMDASVVLSSRFYSTIGLSLKKAGTPDQNYSASFHLFGRRQIEVGHILKKFSLNLNGTNFEVTRGLETSNFIYFTSHPNQYQGIIGWGIFRHFTTVIDFPDRKIILTDANSGLPIYPKGVYIQNRFVPLVSVRLLNHKIPFLVDTGSLQSWISYTALNNMVQIPFFASVHKSIKGRIQVHSLQVGSIPMKDLSFIVAAGFFSRAQNRKFQGILGLNALKSLTVILDSSRKIALIRKNSIK